METMEDSSSPLTWCVVTPRMGPHAGLPAIGPPTTAEQIAEFRARVLFDAGRRPSFRKEGSYADADPLDRHAFQIAIRAEGEIIGCIRTNPTSTTPPSSMASLLGADLLGRVLRSLGVDRRHCWDGGRWAVDPGRQRASIGGELACAAMAVARYLGARRLVGVAGVRGRQAARLVSLGAQYVSSCPTIEARALDDELRVVAFDLDDIHSEVSARIEATTATLHRAWPSSVSALGEPAGSTMLTQHSRFARQ